jgi:hypothetical protein
MPPTPDRTRLTVRVSAAVFCLACSASFGRWLVEFPALFTGFSSLQTWMWLPYMTGSLAVALAGPGMFRLHPWTLPVARTGAWLLCLHLAWVVGSAPFTRLGWAGAPRILGWRLSVYFADLCGPVLLALLAKPRVRDLFTPTP